MKARRAVSLLFLPILVWLAATTIELRAATTIWNGPRTNYVQTAAHSVDVLIPGAVSLTRDTNHWLYNPAGGDLGPAIGTPSNTEWAFGELADYASLSYASFDSYRDGDLEALLVNQDMVVHIINQDIYFALTFTNWPAHGGFISYSRTTPSVAAPTPSVTITNPAGSSIFAAPANVTVAANATVSSGTVTNVSFFANTNTSLGASLTAPFHVTANSLSAGSYALTAVATAAGVSATSSVVNISVVTPVATSLSTPTTANNKFSFGFSANQGLRYVVEDSSNLFNWTPLVTNVASASTVFFTNTISGSNSFFRVGRLPNP
jgi:hypothetical protein